MANEGIIAPSRLGEIDLAGSGFTDLFLKVFAGEVLTQFQDRSVMLGRHRVKTISNGKSAQFPVMGRADAVYHTVGDNIIQDGAGTPAYLNTIAHGERVITIDDLLIAPTMVPSIDEAMNHYDVRSDYAMELGGALARTMDKQLLQLGVLGARASATLSNSPDSNGGAVITKSAAKTTATGLNSLAEGVKEAAQALDEKNVPKDGRFLFLLPEHYYLLLEDATDFINRDFAGVGSKATGDFVRMFGFEVVPTIHLPVTDLSAAVGPAKYQVNANTTAALCLQSSALGTVKLRDLATEMEWKSEYQATFMLAKMLVGHDYLRPECCAEIRTGTPT